MSITPGDTMVLEEIRVNIEEAFQSLVPSLQYIFVNIIIPAVLLIIVTAIILRLTKYILAKLAASRLIPESLVEQIYRPLSSIAYLILSFIILYLAIKQAVIIYLIVIFIVIMLIASLPTLMDTVAYYVILWENKIRPGDFIELENYKIRGQVEALTFTSTLIRRRDGTLVYIPNRTLLASPMRILSPIENRVKIQIEVSLPKAVKSARERLEEIENKIRELLLRERLAPRPQGVPVTVKRFEPSRAILQVEVPLTGIEPRSRQINLLFERIAEELEIYDPKITLLTL